jgi:hypothetical protein
MSLCAQALKDFISFAGTMPPRNPNTRRSPRAPKLKEPEVGEGSSPGPTKQLEFSPRLEPVIRTSTKKIFTQPLAFGDTEENTGGKAILPHWGELFKKINWEEFPEYIRTMTPT